MPIMNIAMERPAAAPLERPLELLDEDFGQLDAFAPGCVWRGEGEGGGGERERERG